jgi:tripeptidyl-peptidase-1
MFFHQEDLDEYMSMFAPRATLTAPRRIIGSNNGSFTGFGQEEATGDIETLMGVGQDIPTVFHNTLGEYNGHFAFYDWLVNLSDTSDSELPLTISASVGFDEIVFDRSRAERINVEFQKLGARGVSLIFASGDGGAAGGSSRSECPPFQPVFPAASPWVTAVGGTTSAYPEVCWKYSSGGFSNYWKRPSFQDAAIEAYLSNPTIRYPDASLYNNTGAGFPDVAAQATDHTVVFDGKVYQSWGGTSAAAPTFTAIIGLVNAARLAAG